MSTDPAVTTEQLDDVCIVSVRGELDMSNADALAEPLRSPETRAASLVVVDLSGCDFLDSFAVSLLLQTERELQTLVLVIDTPKLLRVFELMSIQHIFRIAPDRKTALATQRPGGA